MDGHIVTVSPKGQITIPVSERKRSKHKKYMLIRKGETFVLKPIKIEVIETPKDEEDEYLNNFHLLSEAAFAEVWDNEEDDKAQEFYDKLPNV
jgi:bifunctional DNA-binding transcriptional regulator/antitoxin component of YhaV-PrlF toxin-antitoxin module